MICLELPQLFEIFQLHLEQSAHFLQELLVVEADPLEVDLVVGIIILWHMYKLEPLLLWAFTFLLPLWQSHAENFVAAGFRPSFSVLGLLGLLLLLEQLNFHVSLDLGSVHIGSK